MNQKNKNLGIKKPLQGCKGFPKKIINYEQEATKLLLIFRYCKFIFLLKNRNSMQRC